MATSSIEKKLYETATEGEFRSVIATAEGTEMQVDRPLSAEFYHVLALAYMATGDLPKARFALKRAPAGTKEQLAVTDMASRTLRGLWNSQDREAVMLLTAKGSWPAAPATANLLASLLDATASAVVARTALQFASAYTVTSVAHVAKHFAIDDAKVKAALESRAGKGVLVGETGKMKLAMKPDGTLDVATTAAVMHTPKVPNVTEASLVLGRAFDRNVL